MAKIIKRGQDPRTKPVRHTCGKCKSVIEFTRSDIHGDQRDGNYVKCPVCNSFINSSVVFK